MEKDHIYFLHIPKAGGHWVLSEIIDVVRGDIFVFDKVAHYAWKPVIKSTYLISSWRDPAKRTVSHYCWLVHSGLIPESKLTVKDFFEWVDENKAFLSNFQSKSILSSGDAGGMFFSADKIFLGINNIDEEILVKRIRSFEVFIRDNQMNFETATDVVEKIYSDFPNNERKQGTSKKDRGHNENVNSAILFNKLNQEEIETLYYLNNIDSKIYFDNSLFWNKGK
jgi:hypothetical protein